MAFLQCNFHSDTLMRGCSMNVILPQRSHTLIGQQSGRAAAAMPVLYLLHGMSDDHTIWMRRTSIERYVAPLGIAVVMPDGQRSFYRDMGYGGRFWSFLSEELPEIVAGFFPVSRRREDTFVAGLSMGGYGALKLALKHPDRFAAAASFSGVTDIAHFTDANADAGWRQEMRTIFGNAGPQPGSDDDPFALASQAARAPQRPRLHLECGTEDILYADNVKFRDHLRSFGNCFDLNYIERSGGHTWEFWDVCIQNALQFMFPKQS